jgi:hypothetical protein
MIKDLLKKVDSKYTYEKPTQLDEFANICNNWAYKYFDDDEEVTYTGPMAQELLKIPGYDSCVKEINGHLEVDTNRLALTLAGTVSDLAKRLQYLERANEK